MTGGSRETENKVPRAVVFDRDNTLVELDRKIAHRYRCEISSAAPGLSLEAFSELWSGWQGGWPRAREDEPEFWSEFWGTLAARHEISSSSIARLVELGSLYHRCFRAFPDALECLTTLRAQGFSLAVLTNFRLPSIDLVLESSGIDPGLFEVMESSSSLGIRKPDPGCYLAIAEVLGVPPEDCAYIDDLAENVRGAISAGLSSCWVVDRDRRDSSGDIPTIGSLRQLPPLLLG